jgi:FkbM family methyltransferase
MRDNNYNNRVRLTSSCRDCDNLDRIEEAGQIRMGDFGKKYQYMFNGVKILYGTYHSPWMNRIIKNLKGHHEPQEELCFFYLLKTLGKKASMLELGSNWSYYSIWFNKEIKHPQNICVEPVLENLRNGKSNSNFNNCKNIKFIQACIGKELLQNTIFKNWNGKLIKLPQYNVEYIVKSNKNLYLDIIHSDIQGVELAMLEGAQSVFDNIGYFVISTHQEKHDECINFLKSNHFIILVEHSVEESYSLDGLIVAVNQRNVKKYEENISGSLSEYFRDNCIISRRDS